MRFVAKFWIYVPVNWEYLIILVIWDNPIAARALVSRLSHLETPLVSVSHEAMDNYPLRITKCAIDGRLRK